MYINRLSNPWTFLLKDNPPPPSKKMYQYVDSFTQLCITTLFALILGLTDIYQERIFQPGVTMVE